MKIRTLRPSEIECRVQQVKSNGCALLLYKDARVDQKILDETFSPMGWKREHKVMGTPIVVNEVDKYGKTKEVVKGQYFSCVVSIWDNEKKEWISKEDTGNESNTDEIKGLYSDSFKRACFNIGIGRELYSAPFIWISLNKDEVKEDKTPKGVRYFLDYSVKFEVKEIEYDENREISKLIIADQNGKERFRLNPSNKREVTEVMVNALYKIANDKGYGADVVEKASKRDYGSNVIDMSMNDYIALKDKFKKLEAKKVGA
jgi:hypothetical protein